MDELKEIKRRLSILDIRQNGYIKVEDVRSVIDFIEGLIYFIITVRLVQRYIKKLKIFTSMDAIFLTCFLYQSIKNQRLKRL